MNYTEIMPADNITSIDFDITIDSDCYAQTTIVSASPRCKVYYCFKNDDTREDGENRCTQEDFAEICNAFSKYLANNSTEEKRPAIKCDITLNRNSNDMRTYSEKDFSAETLKKLINLLSKKIDEFSFLTAFKYHI